MSKFKVEISSLALGSLLAMAFACGGTEKTATTPDTTPDTTTPDTTATADPATDAAPEHKGPPWMKPGADIAGWEKEFERETREAASSRKKVVAEMKIQPGAIIADVGAGTGVTLDVFSEAVGKDGKVYALDIAPPFIEWMTQKVAKNGWTNIEVIKSEPSTTTLPDASVDVIYLSAVYHHLGANAKPMMEDFKRILKPGGTFYMLDFDRREGVSTEWVLNHLKLSRADMVNEILSFGIFKEEGSPDARFLDENFVARFVVATP